MSLLNLHAEHEAQKDKVIEETLPEGISKGNASYAAWKAIEQNKLEKLRYIKANGNKTAYRTNKAWQVQRSEVVTIARGIYKELREDNTHKIKLSVQVLFNTASYSGALCELFKLANDDLIVAKDKRLDKKNKGIKGMVKKEVCNMAKSQKDRINELEQLNAKEQIFSVLLKMSTKTRRSLGLN